MRRREFLIVSAAALGGTVVYALDQKAFRLSAEDKRKLLQIPLRFFTQQEAKIVAAAASRIMPTDTTGPGANEAGVAIYIDRQLAGPYGRDRYRYTQGPFEESEMAPEFGYQGKATPREIYREALKSMTGFDRLDVSEQDKILQRMESSRFFSLLHRHTIEGMFCDPIHGGNVDMVGWQMIGFPGPRMSYRAEIEKYKGEAFRPKPMSLSQMTGKKIRPSEDEGLS